MLNQFTLWNWNYKNADHSTVLNSIPYLTVWTRISCSLSSLYAATACTFQTIKNLAVSNWPRPSVTDTTCNINMICFSFFCQLEMKAHRSASFFFFFFFLAGVIVLSRNPSVYYLLSKFLFPNSKSPMGQSLRVGLNCTRCFPMIGCSASTNPPPHLCTTSSSLMSHRWTLLQAEPILGSLGIHE